MSVQFISVMLLLFLLYVTAVYSFFLFKYPVSMSVLIQLLHQFFLNEIIYHWTMIHFY